jgi:hypothetical protein
MAVSRLGADCERGGSEAGPEEHGDVKHMNKRYPDAGDIAKANCARIDPATIFAAFPRAKTFTLAKIEMDSR